MIEKHEFSFFYENLKTQNIVIKHTEKLYFRIVSVLKSRIGDKFILFNETHISKVTIHEIQKKKIILIINSSQINDINKDKKEVIAYVPYLHKSYLEKVFYYCGQTGISKIYLIKTDFSHSINKFDSEITKFKKFIIQGCEEGKQYCIPKIIVNSDPLSTILENEPDIYWFYEKGNNLFSILPLLQNKKKFSFICGPEMGFSQNEIALFQKNHQKTSVQLITNVLRSEDVIRFASILFKSI